MELSGYGARSRRIGTAGRASRAPLAAVTAAQAGRIAVAAPLPTQRRPIGTIRRIRVSGGVGQLKGKRVNWGLISDLQLNETDHQVAAATAAADTALINCD